MRPHVTLKLVMIRCPDNVAPERREVRGGEFSIGRGQDNEWVIPDPERHLSKRHPLPLSSRRLRSSLLCKWIQAR